MSSRKIKTLAFIFAAAVIGSMIAPNLAIATTARVIKAKGKQVLIELPVDPRLKTGDTVDVDTTEFRSPASARTGGPGARTYTVGAGFGAGELDLYSQSNGNSPVTFNVSGRAGWNQVKYEYGPLVSLNYQSISSNNSNSVFGIGGFFDFNFVPNAPGVGSLYGVGGDAQIASDTFKSNGVSTSETGFGVNGGVFYKYFLFHTDVAFRADAQLHVFTFSGATSYTETGLKLLVGLQNYF